MPPEALLPVPRGKLAWPHKHVVALATCLGIDCLPIRVAMALALAACTRVCLGLSCLPMGATLALAATCPSLGNMPIRACLGFGCVPWPWQHAHRGLPWPWLLHALPMGGYLGLGCCMP